MNSTRYPVSSGDAKAYPTHTLKKRRILLSEALSAMGDAGPFRSGPNIATVETGLSRAELLVLTASPTLRSQFNKTLGDVGKLWVEAVRRRQKRLDLIRPPPKGGLSISSWNWTRITGPNGAPVGLGLSDVVGGLSHVPYTLYMHPKGTPKSRTFVNTDLPPITADIAAILKYRMGRLAKTPTAQRAFKRYLLAGV